MITPIQILLVIFVLFAVSRVYLRFREQALSSRMFFFWSFIWIIALLIIISPPITTKLASFFGIGRGVDVIIYISLTLLFYLVFRLYVMIEDLRHQITYVVRHLALHNSSKKRAKGKKRSE